jgi:hypothetical protein
MVELPAVMVGLSASAVMPTWTLTQNGQLFRRETSAAKSSRSPANQSDWPRIAERMKRSNARPKKLGR